MDCLFSYPNHNKKFIFTIICLVTIWVHIIAMMMKLSFIGHKNSMMFYFNTL